MPMIDFKSLDREAGLSRVLTLLGWEAKCRRGKELRGRCPIHSAPESQGDTFAAGPEGWYCHRCKKGGGPFKLYLLATRKRPVEAALELCKLLGIPVPHVADSGA